MSVMLPWLVGEGIISYRAVVTNKRPPLPAELLAVSGLFIILGLLDDYQSSLATLLAWGLDAAAFMALFTNKPTAAAGAGVAAGASAAAAANTKTTTATVPGGAATGLTGGA